MENSFEFHYKILRKRRLFPKAALKNLIFVLWGLSAIAFIWVYLTTHYVRESFMFLMDWAVTWHPPIAGVTFLMAVFIGLLYMVRVSLKWALTSE